MNSLNCFLKPQDNNNHNHKIKLILFLQLNAIHIMRKIFVFYFCTLAIIACKKEPPKPPPLSSNAEIITFKFNTADNAGTHLSSDVYGDIKKDSIILTMPDSVLISALIPRY